MRRAGLAFLVGAWLVGGVSFAQDAPRRYVVDAAQSDLHWLVYKAGALARLGHNHTVAVGDLSGTVSVNPGDAGSSSFELAFSVASLVVDDPTLRSKLGADFASVPTPEDVAGTHKNMLSDTVLDGANHPRIRIVGTGPVTREGKQTGGQGRAAGSHRRFDGPYRGHDQRTKSSSAKGEFELNHADLGMKPFSVMMGALQVGEKLTFTYDVKARRETP